jgi:hypothetical protein
VADGASAEGGVWPMPMDARSSGRDSVSRTLRGDALLARVRIAGRFAQLLLGWQVVLSGTLCQLRSVCERERAIVGRIPNSFCRSCRHDFVLGVFVRVESSPARKLLRSLEANPTMEPHRRRFLRTQRLASL